MTSLVNFFCHVFLLSGLVTGPSFMSISSLVLELWQFSFIRNWPEIQISKIPPFFPISGNWDELETPNLVRVSLMKCYWMLQNAKVTASTVSELLRENQHGTGVSNYLLPIQIKSITSFDILDSSNQNPFVNIIFKLTITVKNYSK